MRNPQHHVARKYATGLSVVELMITLAIASILLGMVVPNLRDFAYNSRLSSSANELLRSMQIARNEAIKLQLPGTQSVVVCASSNPTNATPSCSYGSFTGWIVFQDTNGNLQYNAPEVLIEQHATLDSRVNVRTDNNGYVSYNLTGFANPAGALTPTRNVVICDQRGIAAVSGSTLSYGRALVIAPTGRSRVVSAATDVAAAAALAGGCPT